MNINDGNHVSPLPSPPPINAGQTPPSVSAHGYAGEGSDEKYPDPPTPTARPPSAPPTPTAVGPAPSVGIIPSGLRPAESQPAGVREVTPITSLHAARSSSPVGSGPAKSPAAAPKSTHSHSKKNSGTQRRTRSNRLRRADRRVGKAPNIDPANPILATVVTGSGPKFAHLRTDDAKTPTTPRVHDSPHSPVQPVVSGYPPTNSYPYLRNPIRSDSPLPISQETGSDEALHNRLTALGNDGDPTPLPNPDEGELPGPLPCVYLPYALTKPQLDLFDSLYGRTHRMSRLPQHHPHPFLAHERRVYEESLYSMLDDSCNIIDIGGNPHRHLIHNRKNIWCCTPILTPEDATRNARNSSLPEPHRFCLHKAEDCACVDSVDYYIAVHSIYYLTPDLVTELVDRCNGHALYSLHHMFDRYYGAFYHGEAQYTINSNFEVVMHVRGNLAPYNHSACTWLHNGYYHHSTKPLAIAWSIEQFGPTSQIVKFVPCPSNLTRPPSAYRGFKAAVQDTHYYGGVSLSGSAFTHFKSERSAPEFSTIAVDRFTYVSFGNAIFAYEGIDTFKCQIPKTLIHELAAFTAGKVRDRSTFQTLLSQARIRVKEYDMPPQFLANSIVVGAALAFVYNLEDETAVIQAALHPHRNNMKYLDRVLSFDFPTVIPNWLSFSLTPLLTTIGMWYTPRPLRGVVFLGMAVYSYYTWSRPTKKPTSAIVNDIINTYNASRESTPLIGVGMIPIPADVVFPGTETTKLLTPLSSPYPHHPDRFPSISDRSEYTREIRPAFAPLGIIFPNTIPIVHASTPYNSLVAVQNRQLDVRVAPVFDPIDLIMNNIETICPDLKDSIHEDYFAWNMRFPVSQRKIHDEIYYSGCEFIDGSPEERRLNCFVKIEKLIGSSELGYEAADPRNISARSVIWQVHHGPGVWSFSKNLRRVWNSEFPICYTSGMTAEDLGRRFQQVGHNHPDRHYAETDFSRWDACMQAWALTLVVLILIHAGYPRHKADQLSKDLKKMGSTVLGILFRVYCTTASGSAETSSGASFINGILAILNAMAMNPLMSIHDIMSHMHVDVNGDDGCHANHKNLARYSETWFLAYGFRPRLIYHHDSRHLTFCSGRYWPTDGGIVHGPKIGRFLAKHGHFTLPLPQNTKGLLRSVLIAANVDVAFIPPLASVIHTELRLTADILPTGLPAAEKHKIRATHKHEANDETWAMLSEVYDWTQQDQLEFDSTLATTTSLPSAYGGFDIRKLFSPEEELPGYDPKFIMGFFNGPDAARVLIVSSGKILTEINTMIAQIFYRPFVIALDNPVGLHYIKQLIATSLGSYMAPRIKTFGQRHLGLPETSLERSVLITSVCILGQAMLEELTKRVHPLIKYAVPIIESAVSIFTMHHQGVPLETAIAARIIPTALHIWWASLPLTSGWLAHVIWNFTAIATFPPGMPVLTQDVPKSDSLPP